jgi:hypothetical protein
MSTPDQPRDTPYPATDPAPAPPPADEPTFGTEQLQQADREARRRKREAEVSDEAQQVIAPHVAEFQAARAAYEPALAAAQAARTDADDRLKKITSELSCRLDEKSRNALDNAWKAVKAKLEINWKLLADRPLPKTPDPWKAGDTPETLAPRIAAGRQAAATVDGTFKDLVAEQTGVLPRVTAVAADIEALATAAAADTTNKDGEELYARALVLHWRLDNLLAGFDGVDEYVKKVTDTLAELVTLWDAIRDLEGYWALLTRKTEQDQQDLDAVRADPVKAVLDARQAPAANGSAAAAAA